MGNRCGTFGEGVYHCASKEGIVVLRAVV